MADDSFVAIAFPRLKESRLATLAACPLTRLRESHDGETLVTAGEKNAAFFVVKPGRLEVLNVWREAPATINVHAPGEFTGEVGQLTGSPSLVTIVGRGDGQVYEVSLEQGVFDLVIVGGGPAGMAAAVCPLKLATYRDHDSMPLSKTGGLLMTKSKDDYRTHHPSTVLQPGTEAPDFMLRTTPDQCVTLSELRGNPMIIAFYPADWSPVCGDQLVLYNELLPDFRRHNASLIGISVDGVWSHVAYAKQNKLSFPLLSDFEPKGAVARNYGAYRHQDGVCERALFVLDSKGKIHWSYLSPVGVNPGADGILQALDELSSKDSTDKASHSSKQPRKNQSRNEVTL